MKKLLAVLKSPLVYIFILWFCYLSITQKSLNQKFMVIILVIYTILLLISFYREYKEK
ncbi:hypothetical protein I580_02734 [Enterococcus caccae ATCC BAA-1240]|uniref:Immunity protein n=1 Tax=Enterococcus caccae ATCC BAA-1240 TaxID=1158612 RepID=R3WB54_9ENTE|nr:hypothetical protein UC7_01962 [Enterococcus caccae ATCC BAA-1240]EOT58563.1 hypothetical protein I580_02734 [Enterococcus caccae ATCC BAA-1240]